MTLVTAFLLFASTSIAQTRTNPAATNPARSNANTSPRAAAKPRGQAAPQKQTFGPRQPQATGQQQAPVRQARVPQNVRVAPRQPAGPPNGFKLTPAESSKIDQMLAFWEKKTTSIKTFEAEFARWVYDPTFGPKDDAATFTTGEIRYAAVDRGMIRENAVYDFDAARKKAQDAAKAAYAQAKSPAEKKALEKKINELWPFAPRKDAVGEHWVCDGKSVFEFSHKTKELVEIKLPKEMQGNAIAEGPLPFMFGAKADKIKERYWIRELARTKKEEPYHLELVPKRRGEDYSRIRIKLNAQTFLPDEMVLYDLNLKGRSSYAFRNLKANGTKNNLKNFLGGFVSPKTPRGWTKIVRDVGATPAPGPQQGQPAQRKAAAPTRPKR